MLITADNTFPQYGEPTEKGQYKYSEGQILPRESTTVLITLLCGIFNSPAALLAACYITLVAEIIPG